MNAIHQSFSCLSHNLHGLRDCSFSFPQHLQSITRSSWVCLLNTFEIIHDMYYLYCLNWGHLLLQISQRNPEWTFCIQFYLYPNSFFYTELKLQYGSIIFLPISYIPTIRLFGKAYNRSSLVCDWKKEGREGKMVIGKVKLDVVVFSRQAMFFHL